MAGVGLLYLDLLAISGPTTLKFGSIIVSLVSNHLFHSITYKQNMKREYVKVCHVRQGEHDELCERENSVLYADADVKIVDAN